MLKMKNRDKNSRLCDHINHNKFNAKHFKMSFSKIEWTEAPSYYEGLVSIYESNYVKNVNG